MACSVERGQPPVTPHPGRHRPAEQGEPIRAAVAVDVASSLPRDNRARLIALHGVTPAPSRPASDPSRPQPAHARQIPSTRRPPRRGSPLWTPLSGRPPITMNPQRGDPLGRRTSRGADARPRTPGDPSTPTAQALGRGRWSGRVDGGLLIQAMRARSRRLALAARPWRPSISWRAGTRREKGRDDPGP